MSEKRLKRLHRLKCQKMWKWWDHFSSFFRLWVAALAESKWSSGSAALSRWGVPAMPRQRSTKAVDISDTAEVYRIHCIDWNHIGINWNHIGIIELLDEKRCGWEQANAHPNTDRYIISIPRSRGRFSWVHRRDLRLGPTSRHCRMWPDGAPTTI